jgi:hypothetical protein
MAAANELMKHLAFSDLGRLLQQKQITYENSSSGSLSDVFIVAVAFLFVVPMVVVTIFACVRMREMRENVEDVPESPGDVRKTPKSTLAIRKRAILELFKTSEVTMVSQEQPWDSKRHKNKQSTRNISKLTTYFRSDGDKGRHYSWGRR